MAILMTEIIRKADLRYVSLCMVHKCVHKYIKENKKNFSLEIFCLSYHYISSLVFN